MIEHEGLGQDEAPDFLAISFSVNDLLYHLFGPSSLENEVNMERLDTTLSSLFSFIDRKVGLANTLIVLSGDHGGPEIPEYLQEEGMLGVRGGRVGTKRDPAKKRIVEAGANALEKNGYPRDAIYDDFQPPYVYLDIDKFGGDRERFKAAERIVADAVMQITGIAIAIPASDLNNKSNAEIIAGLLRYKARTSQSTDRINDQLINSIRRNQNALRSGDVYIVQEPQWQFDAQPAPGEVASTVDHGTPWPYDTHVPIVFAGASIPARIVSRPVRTVDVAATLAACLGTEPPSRLAGQPLREVVGLKEKDSKEPSGSE